MGSRRLESYGDEILAVVAEVLDAMGPRSEPDGPEAPEVPDASVVADTVVADA